MLATPLEELRLQGLGNLEIGIRRVPCSESATCPLMEIDTHSHFHSGSHASWDCRMLTAYIAKSLCLLCPDEDLDNVAAQLS